VIVSALDQSDGTCAEVAQYLDRDAREPAGRRPVVVVTPRRTVDELAAALPHCSVVPGPLSSNVLLDSVSGVTTDNVERVSTAGR
jgi:mRNA-degrading endonuclease toxin of MazEF toxin-antitoxin module